MKETETVEVHASQKASTIYFDSRSIKIKDKHICIKTVVFKTVTESYHLFIISTCKRETSVGCQNMHKRRLR